MELFKFIACTISFRNAIISINTVSDGRRKSFEFVGIKFFVLFFRRERKTILRPHCSKSLPKAAIPLSA